MGMTRKQGRPPTHVPGVTPPDPMPLVQLISSVDDDAASPKLRPPAPAGGVQYVVVRDVDITFRRMVDLTVKLGIATIPAVLVFSFLMGLIGALIGPAFPALFDLLGLAQRR